MGPPPPPSPGQGTATRVICSLPPCTGTEATRRCSACPRPRRRARRRRHSGAFSSAGTIRAESRRQERGGKGPFVAALTHRRSTRQGRGRALPSRTPGWRGWEPTQGRAEPPQHRAEPPATAAMKQPRPRNQTQCMCAARCRAPAATPAPLPPPGCSCKGQELAQPSRGEPLGSQPLAGSPGTPTPSLPWCVGNQGHEQHVEHAATAGRTAPRRRSDPDGRFASTALPEPAPLPALFRARAGSRTPRLRSADGAG